MVNIKVIISLGGSLIVSQNIDITFLKKFRIAIIKFIKRGNKVAIICGGGKTCRNYQNAARKITEIPNIDIDLIGIMSTRLNAELIRAIFFKHAYEHIITDYSKKIVTSKPILIGAGWKPGCTTDNDSVLLAKNLHADTIINLTNVDYIYDKDPHKFHDAKPIKKISWKEFLEIIGEKYISGMHVPFDPVAAKKAQQLKLKVIILNGNNLKNLENCLNRKKFKGTVIE